MLAEVTASTGPDWTFYYTLSTLLASGLLVIVWRYSDKVSRTLEHLVKNDVRQDTRLDAHDERLDGLETDGKLVKYNNTK